MSRIACAVVPLLGLTACSAIFGVDFDTSGRPAAAAASATEDGGAPEEPGGDPDAGVRPAPAGDAGTSPGDPGGDGTVDAGPTVYPDSGAPLVNPVVCKPDADGDGYPAAAASVAFSNACPAGWTENVTRKADCDEANADVHPGQKQYFVTARANGSFDYDCDGSQTANMTFTYDCHQVSYADCTSYVMAHTTVMCGATQTFSNCVVGGGICYQYGRDDKYQVGCR